MFDTLEGWPETLGNGRLIDPPLPVTVDLASLFPPGPGRSNTQPLRISKGGLTVTGYAAGELLAWARTTVACSVLLALALAGAAAGVVSAGAAGWCGLGRGR